MKYTSTLLFCLLTSLFGFSQSLKETTANLNSIKITKLSPDQSTDIYAILDEWEKVCGESEPTARIRLLAQIHQGKRDDLVSNRYFNLYYADFLFRMEYDANEKYDSIYQTDKLRLGYIPFRTNLDDWTIAAAKSGYKSAKSRLDSNLCDFFSAKSNPWATWDDKDAIAWRSERITPFYFGVGYLQHFTQNPMAPAVNIELGLFAGLTRKYSLLVDLGFVPFTHDQKIVYAVGPKDSATTTDGIFKLGASIYREYEVGRRGFASLVGGIYYNNQGTGIMKPRKNKDSDTSYYGIANISFPLGVEYRRRFWGTMFGLKFTYVLSPYNMDRRLISNVSSHAFNITLTFRPLFRP